MTYPQSRRLAIAVTMLGAVLAATLGLRADQVGRLAYVREQQVGTSRTTVQIASDEPIAWQLTMDAAAGSGTSGSGATLNAKLYGIDLGAPELKWTFGSGRLTLTSLADHNARLAFEPSAAGASQVVLRVGEAANVLEIVTPGVR